MTPTPTWPTASSCASFYNSGVGHLLLESTASAIKGVTCRTGAAAGAGRRIHFALSRIAIVQPWQRDTAGSVQIPGAVALTTHLAPFSNDYMVSDVEKVG